MTITRPPPTRYVLVPPSVCGDGLAAVTVRNAGSNRGAGIETIDAVEFGPRAAHPCPRAAPAAAGAAVRAPAGAPRAMHGPQAGPRRGANLGRRVVALPCAEFP